jgi:hypothetical protein
MVIGRFKSEKKPGSSLWFAVTLYIGRKSDVYIQKRGRSYQTAGKKRMVAKSIPAGLYMSSFNLSVEIFSNNVNDLTNGQ